MAVDKVIVLDGNPTTYTVVATEIKAESETIRIPIQKTAIQLAQVDAAAEVESIGKINLDHAAMPLDDMWNFAYIGEFFLGSGEP